jgi:3-hydroxy-5-methyl-1-naphthoate 3-O-methyltransferase
LNNKNSFPDPSPIMNLATSYWNSQIFLTANRIGLFKLLPQSLKSIDEIASSLGTQPRPTKLLLNACVALGLLKKEQEQYKNSEITDTFLVPGQPTFMGNAISYSDDLYETWGNLSNACVRINPCWPPKII